MSPTLQLVLVCVLVALAAVYVTRATWKTWFGRKQPGCGSGCGKCAAASAVPPEQKGRFPLPQV